MKKDKPNAESTLLRLSSLKHLTDFANAFSQTLARLVVVLLICSLAFAQNPISAPAASSAPQKTQAANPAPAAQDGAIPPKLTPWQILREGVNTHNAQHRAEAVAALGTIGPNRQVVALVEKALTDKDTSIRQLAARTLGEMQARTSIPKLRKALKDDSPQVSFAAAKSLWTMGDRSGRNVFIEILSGERSSSDGLLKGELDSTKKKFQDPKSLALIGAKEAASSLFGPAGWGISLLEEVHKDRSASARAMSAILLGPDASLDALRELQDALTDQNWIVRAAAAQALGTCHHRDQIQYLRPLLEDDKPAVRYMASASIIRLSNSEPGTAADKKSSLKSEARPVLGPRGPNSLE
jgi:HEAT repeat protein